MEAPLRPRDVRAVLSPGWHRLQGPGTSHALLVHHCFPLCSLELVGRLPNVSLWPVVHVPVLPLLPVRLPSEPLRWSC